MYDPLRRLAAELVFGEWGVAAPGPGSEHGTVVSPLFQLVAQSQQHRFGPTEGTGGESSNRCHRGG